VFREG